MKQVWKYTASGPLDRPLVIEDMLESEILHAEFAPLTLASAQQITLWVEHPHTPNYPRSNRSFLVVGTGHDVPDYADHLRTQRDGEFIWHLYELPGNGEDL